VLKAGAVVVVADVRCDPGVKMLLKVVAKSYGSRLTTPLVSVKIPPSSLP
jgi:hypothetical protein